jgi:hypothetical protein
MYYKNQWRYNPFYSLYTIFKQIEKEKEQEKEKEHLSLPIINIDIDRYAKKIKYERDDMCRGEKWNQPITKKSLEKGTYFWLYKTYTTSNDLVNDNENNLPVCSFFIGFGLGFGIGFGMKFYY